MNLIKLIIPSAAAVALSSCATKNNDYDTSSPYGPADSGASAGYEASPSNQTYDTPAAYEDAGTASSNPNIPAPSAPYAPPASSASAPTSGGAIATTHTVVKGDTLGGIARKHSVSIASIKAANGMTSDVVVLGKTLKIPAN